MDGEQRLLQHVKGSRHQCSIAGRRDTLAQHQHVLDSRMKIKDAGLNAPFLTLGNSLKRATQRAYLG
jgi:hypothetical protein